MPGSMVMACSPCLGGNAASGPEFDPYPPDPPLLPLTPPPSLSPFGGGGGGRVGVRGGGPGATTHTLAACPEKGYTSIPDPLLSIRFAALEGGMGSL
jgi:hypothetical protein